DAASNTGVDNIRELIERSRFAPVQARWKVYVVDECHMLSTAAFNALLKTLEEPPPRVVFVLATTDPQRVLPTILSRCQRFDFRRIPLQALEGHLGWIAGQEGIGITPEALHVVAQRAQGGLRDAESLLDQLSLLPPPIETTAVWELLGAVPEEELLALAEAMATAEPLELIEASRTLLERGREPSAVLQGVAGLLRDLVLAGVAPERLELTSLSPHLRPRLPELARRIGRARLLQWQAQLRGSEQQLRQSVQPRLWLEVLLLGLLAEPATAAAAPAPVPAGGTAAAAPPAPVRHQAPATPATPAAAANTPATSPPAAPAATAAAPHQEPAAAQAAVAAAPKHEASQGAPALPELWQQILAGLELPSTRMLLSQQAHLVRLDEQRAVVRVAATWLAMVQSRLPLLEQALTRALGSPRQLVLEAAEGAGAHAPAVPATAAAAPPVPIPARITPVPPSAPSEQSPQPTEPSEPLTRPPQASESPPNPAPAAAPPSVSPPPPPPPQADTAAPQAATAPPPPPPRPAISGENRLDEQARRLADFFNGEVVELDEPIDSSDSAA
ncbi:MAG: DNA polymerase III subunit gamma/tau, partial [Synechococcus sp.]